MRRPYEACVMRFADIITIQSATAEIAIVVLAEVQGSVEPPVSCPALDRYLRHSLQRVDMWL